MWDIGGHGISNTTMSDRNRSRSPRPPNIRMPSPSWAISHYSTEKWYTNTYQFPNSNCVSSFHFNPMRKLVLIYSFNNKKVLRVIIVTIVKPTLQSDHRLSISLAWVHHTTLHLYLLLLLQITIHTIHTCEFPSFPPQVHPEMANL